MGNEVHSLFTSSSPRVEKLQIKVERFAPEVFYREPRAASVRVKRGADVLEMDRVGVLSVRTDRGEPAELPWPRVCQRRLGGTRGSIGADRGRGRRSGRGGRDAVSRHRGGPRRPRNSGFSEIGIGHPPREKAEYRTSSWESVSQTPEDCVTI